MKKRQFYTLATTILASMVLIACGGGGGGGGGGTPPGGGPTPPSASFAAVSLEELAPSTTFSAAFAVNSTGMVVGASEDATGSVKAVSWTVDQIGLTAGAPTALAPVTGNNVSAAHDVNDGGMAVGRSQKGALTVPVFWAAGTLAVGELLPADTQGAAYSTNSLGQIAGESQIGAGGATHATLWNTNADTGTDLDPLASSPSSAAYYISDAGTIVGESDDGTGSFFATMWTVDAAGALLSGPTVLATINVDDAGSIAMGVNDAGEVVGEVELASGEFHAVRWDASGAITDLGTTGFNSSAQAVNTAGNIAGWNSDAGTALVARYDAVAAGFERLLDDVTTFSESYGLNNNGTTVGISGTQALAIIPR